MNSPSPEIPYLAVLEERYHHAEAPQNPIPPGTPVAVGMIATISPGLLQSSAQETYNEHRDASHRALFFKTRADQFEAIRSQNVQTAEGRRKDLEELANQAVHNEINHQFNRALDGLIASVDENPGLARLEAEARRLANQDPRADQDAIETARIVAEYRANAQEAEERAIALQGQAVLAEEIFKQTEALSLRGRLTTRIAGSLGSIGLAIASIYACNTIAESQPEAAATGTEIAGYSVGGVLALAGIATSFAVAHKRRARYAQRQARRQIAKARKRRNTSAID